ncbi:MAG: hypothetical protein DU429_05600 [Candidatus Tokpelaia sp.]|nr:MAG: hypothetical protein DU430_04820 [Candidatus Tokpelaia sp.]KAA6206808.1 MAG: hypothetical protein DU429_05600 [Candidatus Tokpelaia sp.]KAA6406205.1 hypothetical protein DPQ22_00670 [Candidatus Tokpelaia sp.]
MLPRRRPGSRLSGLRRSRASFAHRHNHRAQWQAEQPAAQRPAGTIKTTAKAVRLLRRWITKTRRNTLFPPAPYLIARRQDIAAPDRQ